MVIAGSVELIESEISLLYSFPALSVTVTIAFTLSELLRDASTVIEPFHSFTSCFCVGFEISNVNKLPSCVFTPSFSTA